MGTLKLFIIKKYFDQIALGDKTIEYRAAVPYRTSRLYYKGGKKKPFENIGFINGYRPDSPRMITEYRGLSKRTGQYDIQVGKILKRKNFKKWSMPEYVICKW